MDHLRNLIEELAHLLPSQGGIKDFIHHNTLHAFQNHKFHDAVAIASSIYGANTRADTDFYQRIVTQGELRDKGIQFVCDHICDGRDFQQTKRDIERKSLERISHDSFVENPTLRSLWKNSVHVDLDRVSAPVLIRLTSNYLDQGIALWKMPDVRHSFWHSLKTISLNSYLPMIPLNSSSCAELLQLTPLQAIKAVLTRMLPDLKYSEVYLKDTLLTLKGWAGFVHQIEQHPHQLDDHRNITLVEWLAAFLVIDWGWLEYQGRGTVRNLSAPEMDHHIAKGASINSRTPQESDRRMIQEVLEWSYYLDLLGGVSANKKLGRLTSAPDFQAIFCLDDRAGSLRRHLEEIHPKVETFGTAGFFNIDCFIKNSKHGPLLKHAPLPVNPKHVLIENDPDRKKTAWLTRAIYATFHSRSLFRGWFFVYLLGLSSAWHLLMSVFWPYALERRRLSWISSKSRIKAFKERENPHADHGLQQGFTREEAAQRIAGMLRTIGLTKEFAPLVFVIAHGSSSTNNPYFAAYDCGACSGKPGLPNARAFCEMANDSIVRSLISKDGINIPEHCLFVPGLHDTCADIIDLFDYEAFSEATRGLLNKYAKILDQALEVNAWERCRRFAPIASSMRLQAARKHVRNRSVALYEPRPEYNHANNSACVVGRRALTRGLFMDRRVFLQSYDYRLDASGEILESILKAVIPVCGGINLEYFFSRIDPEKYGAGSKLPHNVVGLIGVMSGLESDFRTGLPRQMTEIHDPLRLLILIEQEPEMVKRVLKKLGSLQDWVLNEWVRLVVLDPQGDAFYLFHRGEFLEIESGYFETPEFAAGSPEIFRGRQDNIKTHCVGVS